MSGKADSNADGIKTDCLIDPGVLLARYRRQETLSVSSRYKSIEIGLKIGELDILSFYITSRLYLSNCRAEC